MSVALSRRYGSAAEAERIRRSLESDRPAYLATRRVGATLRIELQAEGAASARATLDDLIACLGAAERTGGLTSPARPAPAARRRG
ncbi:MAG: KEOPS complex subunit Pcc1 [Thermoplasmata archaeon]